MWRWRVWQHYFCSKVEKGNQLSDLAQKNSQQNIESDIWLHLIIYD